MNKNVYIPLPTRMKARKHLLKEVLGFLPQGWMTEPLICLNRSWYERIKPQLRSYGIVFVLTYKEDK